METINIHFAKTHLSKIIQEVENGSEIILSRAGTPIAKITPYNKPSKSRIPGLWQQQTKANIQLEELPTEIINSFYE
jgi:prevent-host-death family protein